jgi:hypothetical protein
MNLLFHSIAKGGQDTRAVWAYSSGELRLRISIRSDSVPSQSHAHAEMWDARGLEWHPVASLHHGEMKTPPALYVQNQWNNESAYRADHDELLRRAALIVHGWGEPQDLLLEPRQFNSLREIEKGLYGDGSALTPDTRRDLANRLNLILNQVRDQNE